ncbi:MAG: GNAT family N-acetyltransferase [Marinobacterium sp.]|nr:GNAT family N-acetyltransferase [Marinobacterium sp.]
MTAQRARQSDTSNAMSFRLAPFWWHPLQGKHLTLVRLTTAHHAFVLKCHQDNAFQQRYNLFQSASVQAITDDLKQAEKHPLESNRMEWVVEKQGIPIGLVALTSLDMKQSRAELLVGFPDVPTPFNSVEATLLVLEFAFATLGLEKIYSHVYANNLHSQKSSIHIGFEQEGLLKSHIKAPDSNDRLDLYTNGYLPEAFYQRSKTIRLFKRLFGRHARQSLNTSTHPVKN